MHGYSRAITDNIQRKPIYPYNNRSIHQIRNGYSITQHRRHHGRTRICESVDLYVRSSGESIIRQWNAIQIRSNGSGKRHHGDRTTPHVHIPSGEQWTYREIPQLPQREIENSRITI